MDVDGSDNAEYHVEADDVQCVREDDGDSVVGNLDEEESSLATKFVSLEPEELVLSDVHMDNPADLNGDNPERTTVSRFVFRRPSREDGCVVVDARPSYNRRSCPPLDVDEDGDFVLPVESGRSVLAIEHRMATELTNVGAQVWRGALLLADFIMSHQQLFLDKVVVELGAGVGLTALVLHDAGCRRVFATDCSDLAMEICARNCLRNADAGSLPDGIQVRRFDWLERKFQMTGDRDYGFGWKNEDILALQNGFLVVAADVVYSDECTNAFFDTLVWMTDHFRCDLSVFLALEVRLNFTIDDLKVCSPPYRNFLRNVEKLCAGPTPRMDHSKLSTDFPQCFQYERVEELELWRFQIRHHKG